MKAPATLDEFYRTFPTERRCGEALRRVRCPTASAAPVARGARRTGCGRGACGGAALDESAVDGLLDHSWLPAPFAVDTLRGGTVGTPGTAHGDRGERETIAAALLAERGNVTRAAQRLGLARSTLRYRMRQLGL